MTARPRLGVVVPARDERVHLRGCLAGIETAAERLAGRASLRVVVVLDACRDDSVEATTVMVAGARPEVHAVQARNVGVARAAGAARLLTGPDRVDWIATTDADSMVPPEWLDAHLDALAAGEDALLGTVCVADWQHRPHRTRSWFEAVHAGPGDTHPHVHGANLGVRAEAYRAAGGFPPLPCGEDVALVEALERSEARLRRTRSVPVITSARTAARVNGGFAHRLAIAPR